MITNNIDFCNYMTNRGVWCTYFKYPPKVKPHNELVVVFTNDYHALSVCGNRFQDNNKDEFVREASELMDWFDCGNRVIMISNVIKLGTSYMRDNFKLLQQRYDKFGITKQVIHTKDIGSLLVPHKMQLRYKGIKPIEFDIVATDNIVDPKYRWLNEYHEHKRQQVHYMNVINVSRDTETRRKLRYIPEYALFSQLYKKLYL